MPLSEWPEHFRRDDFNEPEMVTVEFEEEMRVEAVTDKAIGLSDGDVDFSGRTEIQYWLPKSQLSQEYEQGEWIDEIELPLWLAEEKGLA